MKHLFDVDVISKACERGSCACGDASLDESATLTEAIQQHYTAVAERGATDCPDPSCCGDVSQIYSGDELDTVTPAAAGASAGCGNPVGVADARPGETVIDLGSGGGIDCFLAAQAVGEEGHVYGVDMTHAMVALARENAGKLGAKNVTFLLGQIEAAPRPDASADLVISNCVIALAPDKDLVFQEIFRLLRPGGRFVISDLVSTEELPEEVRRDAAEWVACIGGADLFSTYMQRIEKAGFGLVEVLSDVPYGDDSTAGARPGQIRSVTVRAFKPEA